MQFEEELFFRKLVEEGELITQAQLEECLLIQQSNPKASSLFVIMIEKGYINHRNMGVILKKVPPQMQQQGITLKKVSKKFGELCVEKGFATTAQVAECLKIQERLQQEGKHIRLGQILYEKKYLALHQAQAILDLQGKRILRCSACENKYNIKHFKSNKTYQCPKCGGDLSSYELAKSGSMGVDRSFMSREAVEVDDESLSLLNRKIGDYTIVELLGEGGMASVYKVENQFGRRARALKVMKSQAGLERFTREFESASALRHPNIIRVYERGVFEGRPYFFMEYIDGGTLTKRVEKMGVIPLLEGLNIIKQVTMGLKYAHENNIVHRDIKTSNIMLSRDSSNKITAKVTDFGIARAASDSHITMTGQLVGTFKYMAPEYIKGVGIDGKSDIFSLGIVAYEMFTGREPFEVDAPVGYLFVNIKETPPPIHHVNPDLPKNLTALVNQMMAKDARRRYDAAALLRDVDRLIRHIQHGDPLCEIEDRSSAFYSRARLYSLKGIWEKISQKFSPGGAEEEIPIEVEDAPAAPARVGEIPAMERTEEVPKETTAKEQFEFALDMAQKGNLEVAQKHLEAIIEVFPGTSWAVRAKKEIAGLHGNSPQEEATGKKKLTLKRYRDESALSKTQINFPPLLPELDTRESSGKISTDAIALTQRKKIGPPERTQRRKIGPPERFEALVPRGGALSESKPPGGTGLEKRSTIRKAQDFLVSVKAFINNVSSIEEYEQKKPWLDEILEYMLQVTWNHAQEEVSELFYKWGRFLLDHEKTEGLSMFWELYERFPNTRWHAQVFEELVALEQLEDMVFLDGGNFHIGENEIPIDLKPYFLDNCPVTNAKYLEFVKETGHPPPVHWIGGIYPIGKANHPVVWVSAEDAAQYASWRGKRLPTEAEWEKAARGPEGWLWPWGNRYESCKCNCRETAIGDTTPVGSYETGCSPYNCSDMSGNVWEWTDSWHEPKKAKHKVLKGGSWFSLEKFTSAVSRNFDYPEARSGLYGFRCAKSFCRPERGNSHERA